MLLAVSSHPISFERTNISLKTNESCCKPIIIKRTVKIIVVVVFHNRPKKTGNNNKQVRDLTFFLFLPKDGIVLRVEHFDPFKTWDAYELRRRQIDSRTKSKPKGKA